MARFTRRLTPRAAIAALVVFVALAPAPTAFAEPGSASALSVVQTQRLDPFSEFTHDALSAHIGATISYEITVSNTGGTALTSVVVSHPYCASLNSDTPGFDGVGDSLSPGQTVAYHCSHLLVAADLGDSYVASVNVTATDPAANPVAAGDSVTTSILRPVLAIEITQRTGGDAFTNDQITVDAGQIVDYRIVVTNTGNTALYSVGVAAPKCGELTSANPQFGGISDTYQPGDSVVFECSHLLGRGIDTYTNGPSVVGYDALSGGAQAADAVIAEILHPAITLSLTQSPRGTDTFGTGPIDVHVGDRIDYRAAISNTGDAPVTMDLATVGCPSPEANVAGFDGVADSYQPGETVVFTCGRVIADGEFTPVDVVAEVVAQDVTSALIRAEASVTANVLHPALSVVVRQHGPTQKSWTEAPIEVLDGDTISYTITVSNTGDTPLSDVDLTANGCADPTSARRGFDGVDDTFAVNDSVDFTCRTASLSAVPPFWKNVATSEGRDVIGGTARDQATADAAVSTVPAGAVRVEGKVFNDKDGSGLQDEGETPIEEAVVYSDLNGSGRRERGEPAAATRGDGYYRLSVAPGALVVRLDTVQGMVCNFPKPCSYSFDLPGGTIKTSVDFGALGSGSQTVAGARIGAGTAKLSGRTGCVKRPFEARVTGKRITSVTFAIDGKRLKKVTRPQRGAYRVRVAVTKLRRGVHRLAATVRFKPSTSPKTKKLGLSFQRCSGRFLSPRFTS